MTGGGPAHHTGETRHRRGGPPPFRHAYLAYVPVLVPAGQRPGAQGMIEVTQSTGQLAGPAVGGWLVQVLTAPVAVAVDAAS